MKKAIIYKEWLKTRMVFFICLTLCVATGLYAVVMMNRLVSLKGVDHLWLIMLLKDNVFIDSLKYIPTIAGVAIGVAQMLPEMSHKRLKLTLHLPYSRNRLVGMMLAVGVCELLAIYLLQLLIPAIYDSTILPRELVGRVILTAMPWYFAGLTAYMFVVSVCLEGTKRRRIFLGLLGIAVIMVFFLQPAPEAYNGMILLMIILSLLLSILTYGSVRRFREGHCD